MATIPASAIVSVIPSVASAGGTALVENGLMLTTSYRVPTGTVQSFVTAAAVGAFFGLGSAEYAKALLYFGSFANASQYPATLLVAQWTPAATNAWLKSGPVNGLTIAQLAAITGSLTVTVDGYARTIASLNLSAATSYSSAATILQTAFNTSLPAGGVSAASGGTIASVSTTFSGQISGNVLTVTSAPTNPLVVGAIITVGATAGTQIEAQLSGTTGGIGTYAVQTAQLVASGTAFTATYGTLTLTGSNASGTFSVGQTLTGGTTTAGTQITALGTGIGAAGTYYVSPSQTVSAATITGTGSAVTVVYDSTSGSFFINSGVMVGGAPSTITQASGTAAAPLFLTTATGATQSQGAAAMTPGTYMTNLTAVTQNWASFFTLFDPDGGSANGPTQKLLFSQWTSQQNNRYAYLAWDTDVSPTISSPATTSLGYQAGVTLAYSGTVPIYDPSNFGYAAFVAGAIASINFNAVNGRTTLAFRSQTTITAAVTNQQVAANLLANGYNFYGAYATANANFAFFYNGSITGPFLWLDSFVNQIYMNNAIQLALMNLITQIGSIPYNSAGYAIIETACLGVIQQMISFGAIRTGVNLSSTEIINVNNAAGYRIDDTLTNQGWFFQVQPASPQVRQARTTPVIYFWYTDGQSVQQLTINSVEVQ